MDALVQFLTGEIRWVGQRLTPTAGQVLAELCRKAKASDPTAGIKVKLEFLGSHGPRQASPRAVDDAVALLLQVGLIVRERRRPRGARLKEEVALTHLNPAFIEIALAWHRQRAALRAAGKRGHLAYPSPAEIELPMTFALGLSGPRDLHMAITPKKDAPSGNPMPMRVASAPARKYCALQHANFAETGIHTPLAVRLDMGGLGDQGAHSSAVSAARERRSPSLPPATAGWGGGAQFIEEPVPEVLSAPPIDSSMAGRPLNESEGMSRSETAMRERCANSTRLAIWIMKQNGGNRDHLTRLVTIRCSNDGRYSGGELPIGKYSKNAESIGQYRGLSLTSWEDFFKMVHAREKKISKSVGEFIGESLFAGPREGSRILLLDDVKSATPLFDGFACAVLETSYGNFQHLYAGDQDMTNEDRHHAHRVLYESTGYKSDPGALSGHQAHRWPGSVNLKPGRGRFWTRLVYLADGKKHEIGNLLAKSQLNRPSALEKKVPGAQQPRTRPLSSGTDSTASGRDWGRAIGMLKSGRSAAEVEAFLQHSVRQPGRQPRDETRCAHYVSTTLDKLRQQGFLSG
ncbi:DNA-primase RepB domain-containing protein [Variovorax sp. KBS0712]|uniref:DNA-primase RepB domain-containing protein n=1 Tax=Variovorax sp. KBS0712 TaxID=2578111 RepID=UPI00163D81BC|nr:DNA-primase RepB domain-containing protein [Variovorax sp. KBS0712]